MRCALLLPLILLLLVQCSSSPNSKSDVAAQVGVTPITVNLSPGALCGSYPGRLAEVVVIQDLGIRCVVEYVSAKWPNDKWLATVSLGTWIPDDSIYRENITIPLDLTERLVALAKTDKPSLSERHGLAASARRKWSSFERPSRPPQAPRRAPNADNSTLITFSS
jgi:hypothetical protein